MKKHTIRLTLAFMPFLLAGTTIVNAEITPSSVEATVNDSTTETTNLEPNSDTTETTDVLESSDQSTKESTSAEKEPLTLTIKNKTLTGSSGKLELEKVGNIQPEGEFKPFENDVIKVEKDGSWTALKTGKTEFELEYILLPEVAEAIQKENSEYLIEKSTTTNTIKADLELEKANISLEVVGGPLKNVDGQIKVKVKDGQEVTGTFKPLSPKDDEPIKIEEDGTYLIGKKARYNVLNEKATFKLSPESHAALVKENPNKLVEEEYEVTLAKKAQKDIEIQFKNKGITTYVGDGSRLFIKETIVDPDNPTKEISLVDIDKAKFKPLSDNEFLSIDELGNWKALKAGKGPLTPTIVLADSTIEALEKEFDEFDINITSETLDVVINPANGKNGKTYAPVKTLPQTGEEKMKFAGTIGAGIIVLAGILFYFKKKKSN